MLPATAGARTTASLVVSGQPFEAGINAPPDNDYAWISPDLLDVVGATLTLRMDSV